MGNEYNFKRKKDVPPNNNCIKKKCVLIPSYYGRSVQHTKNSLFNIHVSMEIFGNPANRRFSNLNVYTSLNDTNKVISVALAAILFRKKVLIFNVLVQS